MWGSPDSVTDNAIFLSRPEKKDHIRSTLDPHFRAGEGAQDRARETGVSQPCFSVSCKGIVAPVLKQWAILGVGSQPDMLGTKLPIRHN
jgi:hypothetical protein